MVCVSERNFNTHIAHGAHIALGIKAVSAPGRTLYRQQHIFCVAHEEIDIGRQQTVTPGSVNASVPCLGAFPLATLVYVGKDGSASAHCLAYAEGVAHKHVLRGEDGLVKGVVGNFVVTNLSPSQAQLHVVEFLKAFHEGLFAHLPCKGGRGEIAPCVLGELV